MNECLQDIVLKSKCSSRWPAKPFSWVTNQPLIKALGTRLVTNQRLQFAVYSPLPNKRGGGVGENTEEIENGSI